MIDKVIFVLTTVGCVVGAFGGDVFERRFLSNGQILAIEINLFALRILYSSNLWTKMCYELTFGQYSGY